MKRLLYVIIFLLINQITYGQMRTFNDREKQIIEILCRIDYGNIDFLSYHLQNEYFLKDYNQALFVLTKNKTALLYLKKEVFDDMNLRKKELYLFIEFISLIDYLKSERYITIFPNNHVYESELHIIKQSFMPKIDNKNNIVILNDKGLHISPKEAQYLLDKMETLYIQQLSLNKISMTG
ncbi:MAG: hypothetical protein K9N07_01670 [Candidatus Cloacimonetes bacterium]|nr:hypothetical protein [Candidatus Cloacimonadota bacterium]